MKHWHWSWPPLQRRRLSSLHLAARGVRLGLLFGLLLTGTLVLRPAAHAHSRTARASHSSTVPLQAQDTPTPRLETFVVAGGVIEHKWSDDNGAHWTPTVGVKMYWEPIAVCNDRLEP